MSSLRALLLILATTNAADGLGRGFLSRRIEQDSLQKPLMQKHEHVIRAMIPMAGHVAASTVVDPTASPPEPALPTVLPTEVPLPPIPEQPPTISISLSTPPNPDFALSFDTAWPTMTVTESMTPPKAAVASSDCSSPLPVDTATTGPQPIAAAPTNAIYSLALPPTADSLSNPSQIRKLMHSVLENLHDFMHRIDPALRPPLVNSTNDMKSLLSQVLAYVISPESHDYDAMVSSLPSSVLSDLDSERADLSAVWHSIATETSWHIWKTNMAMATVTKEVGFDIPVTEYSETTVTTIVDDKPSLIVLTGEPTNTISIHSNLDATAKATIGPEATSNPAYQRAVTVGYLGAGLAAGLFGIAMA